jgi:hypothetical protein
MTEESHAPQEEVETQLEVNTALCLASITTDIPARIVRKPSVSHPAQESSHPG